jgi:CRP/FNR family cyclic AMP-dependent transcriptional regulator
MDLEQALTNAPLFLGLDPKHIRKIANAAKVVRYDTGHVIIEEGSGGYGGMGVVLSGSCKVTKQGKPVAEVKSGQVFGEMSLIDDRPRSATVTASEPTEAAEISAWEFRAQIKENPDLALNLLKSMSLRLREAGAGMDAAD